VIVPELAERILVLEDYCCRLVLDLSPNSMSRYLTMNLLMINLLTASRQIANLLLGNLLTVNQSLDFIRLGFLNHHSSRYPSHYSSRCLSHYSSRCLSHYLSRSRSLKLSLNWSQERRWQVHYC